MSDQSQGPGWWQASNGLWYPPEQRPRDELPPPPVGEPAWNRAPVRPGGDAPPWVNFLVTIVLLAIVAMVFRGR